MYVTLFEESSKDVAVTEGRDMSSGGSHLLSTDESSAVFSSFLGVSFENCSVSSRVPAANDSWATPSGKAECCSLNMTDKGLRWRSAKTKRKKRNDDFYLLPLFYFSFFLPFCLSFFPFFFDLVYIYLLDTCT